MTASYSARVVPLALAFICQTTAMMATPANDDFAARAVLSPSGTATSIDNTGASLEGTEPIPSGFTAATYQATAWWVKHTTFIIDLVRRASHYSAHAC